MIAEDATLGTWKDCRADTEPQLRGSDTRTKGVKKSLEEDGPQLEYCPLAPGLKYVLRKLRWEWNVSRDMRVLVQAAWA